MKKIFLKSMVSICCLLFSLLSISQTIIDYQAWNPANPPCDIFDVPVYVPATVNGSAGSVLHTTMRGDVKYNATALKAVQLDNNYVNTTDIRGTKYRLAYNFKAGYRYLITVTAAELNSTAGFSNGPYLRLDLSSDISTSSSFCNGPQTVNSSYSGNPSPFQFSSTTFQDVPFQFTSVTSAYSQLVIL